MHNNLRLTRSLSVATALFLAGILTVQQIAELPNLYWGLSLAIIVPLALFIRLIRLVAFYCCGCAWALLHAHLILSSNLDPQFEGKDVTIRGVITSLPQMHDKSTRFEFKLTHLYLNGQEGSYPNKVRLSWYNDAPLLHVGQQWQLVVRLKRPHGLSNPGGFDYEGWLFQNRIRATGYVRADSNNQLLAAYSQRYVIDSIREKLSSAIRLQLPDSPYAGMITALANGDVREITSSQWEVLRRTGTTHLIAISGMHVTMIAGLLFFLVKASWARSAFLASRLPAPIAAGVAAIIAALAYSLLAGFSVPTQRAWIMITVIMVALLIKRHRAINQVLAVALLVVLLIDPFAVMDIGFWLSFGAVAIIFYGTSGRVRPGGWWWKWGKIHVLITIGLTPLLLLFFQQTSWVSPLANFVAVPWITLLVIPPALIGTAIVLFLPQVAQLVLSVGDYSLAILWTILQWLAQPSWAIWNHPVSSFSAIIAAVVGVALLLAPRGVPIRWIGIFWFLPLLTMRPNAPEIGEYQFTLLDVGQGLAAYIRTNRHILIFDTGPRFSDDFDTGQAVIVPYLIAQGAEKIDTLIVSHGDNDHKGGVDSLIKLFPVEKIITSVPDQIKHTNLSYCAAGQRWQWDGINFEILNPMAGWASSENNLSCVLRVSNRAGSVLITGDIEKEAESKLLEVNAAGLKTDILVIPHHGSKTSSTDEFVDATAPVYALFPVGYRNRYNFPKSEIVSKYLQKGSQLLDSAKHGAITFDVTLDGIVKPQLHRFTAQRYWHTDLHH